VSCIALEIGLLCCASGALPTGKDRFTTPQNLPWWGLGGWLLPQSTVLVEGPRGAVLELGREFMLIWRPLNIGARIAAGIRRVGRWELGRSHRWGWYCTIIGLWISECSGPKGPTSVVHKN
jgi:hypothetical protein